MGFEEEKKKQKIVAELEAMMPYIGIYDTILSLGCGCGSIVSGGFFLVAYFSYGKTGWDAFWGSLGLYFLICVGPMILASNLQSYVVKRVLKRFNQRFTIEKHWQEREMAIEYLKSRDGPGTDGIKELLKCLGVTPIKTVAPPEDQIENELKKLDKKNDNDTQFPSASESEKSDNSPKPVEKAKAVPDSKKDRIPAPKILGKKKVIQLEPFDEKKRRP